MPDAAPLRILLDLDRTNAPLLDRRYRASQLLSLTPESFRKSREVALVEQLASNLLLQRTLDDRPHTVGAGAAVDTELSNEDVEGFLLRYFSALSFETRAIGFAQSESRLNMDALYVDQWVVRGTSEAYESAELHSSELLDHSKRLVIIGHPGAGKTTLFMRIARDAAAERDPSRIPLMVRLSDFAISGLPLAEYLDLQCRLIYQLQAPPRFFENVLKLGHAILLLDGLDEVAHLPLRVQVKSMVEHSANQYPGSAILVSSRPASYREAALDESLFARFELAGLDPTQKSRLLHAWLSLDPGSAEESTSLGAGRLEGLKDLEAMVHQDAALQSLSKVPLFLVLLCQVFTRTRSLPLTEAATLEHFTRLLRVGLDRERGIDRPPMLSGDSIEVCTRIVAKMLRRQHSKTLAERSVLEGLITELASRGSEIDTVPVTAEKFVEFCRARSWVFTELGVDETGEGQFGFSHLAFEEFYADGT